MELSCIRDSCNIVRGSVCLERWVC